MLYTTTVNLNVRKGRSRFTRKRGTIPKGTNVLVRSDAIRSGWAHVHVLGLSGWVRFSPRYLRHYAKPPRLHGKVIINDIGHGWHNRRRGVYDPGADPKGAPEEHKDVERFVKAVSTEQRNLGAIVEISHDKPLGMRKAARKADATSYHLNAGGGTGVEVWVPWGAGPVARAKAERIGRALAKAQDLPWRGVKRTRHLAVLNQGFDRLVEVYFEDNPTDRAHHAKHFHRAVDAVVANT